MEQISKYALDKLEECQKEYYKLLAEREDIKRALKPLIAEILFELQEEDFARNEREI